MWRGGVNCGVDGSTNSRHGDDINGVKRCSNTDEQWRLDGNFNEDAMRRGAVVTLLATLEWMAVTRLPHTQSTTLTGPFCSRWYSACVSHGVVVVVMVTVVLGVP